MMTYLRTVLPHGSPSYEKVLTGKMLVLVSYTYLNTWIRQEIKSLVSRYITACKNLEDHNNILRPHKYLS